jgi:hypothetical protein
LIQEKSAFLTLTEKLFLHNTYEKSAGIPAVANMLTGLGLGSFLQGDTVSGVIQLSGVALGAVSLFIAFIPGPYARVAVATGMASCSLSWLYGCVSPFVFKHSYNRTLKRALHYDNNVTFQIAPAIDADGNGSVSSLVSFKL